MDCLQSFKGKRKVVEGEESDQEVAQVRCVAPRLDRMRTASACHPLNEGVLRHWGEE